MINKNHSDILRNRQTNIVIVAIGIILLVAANLAFILYSPTEEENSSYSDLHEHINVQADLPEEIVVFVESFPSELSCGEQVVCAGDYSESVLWSSSDDSILAVQNGTVTALKAGSASVTVRDINGANTYSAQVTVLDDWRENTVSALKHIVVSGTDVTAASAVRKQHERLSRCTDPGAADMHKALNSLIAFVDGGEACDFNALSGQLSMTAGDLRFAAECMHMQSQLSDSTVTLTFTGDCTFGYLNDNDSSKRFPEVYRKSGSVTYPFDRVKHIFAADDLTVINYEATLAQKGTAEADKKYHFRGEPEYVDILTQSSVEVANLANNHTLDYLQEGFDRTVELLSGGGVATLTTDTPVITQIKGMEIVLIGAGHWKFPSEIDDAVNAMSQQIAQYKKPDNLVIVNLHWGGEYVSTPTESQIKAAHSLIDQGADMIVGHHAHIIQGIEVYKGKVIAYGLGNFSFGGTSTLEEKESFILRASFGRNDDGTTAMEQWSVVPCYASSTGELSNNFQPMPLHGENARSMMNLLIRRSKMINGCEEFPYFYYE